MTCAFSGGSAPSSQRASAPATGLESDMPLNAKLDKATYNAGDTMTLTVTTTAEERDRYVETPGTVNVSVPGVGEGVASFVLRRQTDDVSVSVSDPERQWALVSDDGVTAVYTATA